MGHFSAALAARLDWTRRFFVMGKSRHLASRCQVCRHDERWRIELLRAGGASLDSLAEKFDLSRDVIFRHWHNHVPTELKASYLAGPVQLQELASKAAEQGGSVLDHLHAVRTMLMGHLANATEAGDGRLAAYVSGRLVQVLETIAKVSGELGSMAGTINFNTINNVAVLSEHPAFARLQSAVLRALGPFPDARAAVVGALRQLDDDTAPATISGPAIEHAAA